MKPLLIALILLAGLGVSANADVYRPAYLEIRQTDAETYDLLWKLPARGPDARQVGGDLQIEFDAEPLHSRPEHRQGALGGPDQRNGSTRTGSAPAAHAPCPLVQMFDKPERGPGDQNDR